VLDAPPDIVLLGDIDGGNAYVLHACEHDHIDHWREAGAKLLKPSKRDAWVKQGDSQP